MNLCEKSGVWTNVQAGFGHFKKDVKFCEVKKLFVLQEKIEENLPEEWRIGNGEQAEA